MSNKRLFTTIMANGSVRWAFNWRDWQPNEADFRYAVSCLQLEEKIRIGRFAFRKDARASLVGRLMIRKFINETTNISYEKIKLSRDKNNRPIVLNLTKSIDFNVSHQGDFTVLAGELCDVKIGIDVMKLEYTGGKNLSEFFRLMNNNFSSTEWQEIIGSHNTIESKQIAMFCRHWALKESYVKALGVGIVVDLKSLDFHTKSNLQNNQIITDTILYKNGVKQNWLFEESLINDDHCVAVALPKDKLLHETTVKFEHLNYKQLVSNAISLYPEDEAYTKDYFLKPEKP